MLLRLRNAVASMSALVRRQEITANNLANVNTVGFRRDRVFESVLESATNDEGLPESTREISQFRDDRTGELQHTARELDTAIVGDGYFEVEDPDTGQRLYTRSGQFTIDPEGTLVDGSGRFVQSESGPLTVEVEAGPVTVSEIGELRAGNQVIGRIRVVRFARPDELQRMDAASFEPLGQEPETVDNPKIKQGFLESSNVNAVSEMTDMILTSRLFESQQRAIRTIDQVLERATRELGRY